MNDFEQSMETVEQDSRKTREQVREERRINASMVRLSGRNRNALGIISIEPNKSIFALENNRFVKIYRMKGVELTPSRKKTLIDALCNYTSHRMRISSFVFSESNAPLVYLSVYFTGEMYSDVASDIKSFDENLGSIMAQKFLLSFEPCDVGDLFTIINMNFSGQMKKITTDRVMSRSTNMVKEFFVNIKEQEQGFAFDHGFRVGETYIAMQYPDFNEVVLFDHLKKRGISYISCLDFQEIDTENLQSYEKYLEKTYNRADGIQLRDGVNASFLLGVTCRTNDDLQFVVQSMKRDVEESGLVLGPGKGVEKEIFESLATFGLKDFHCMRKVNYSMLPYLIG